MADFFEIDPVTGIRTHGIWHENEQHYELRRTADVEPVLDMAAHYRNEGGLNRKDMMTGPGWWRYCTIPPIVMLQLRAKGIDIYNKDHSDRMIAEINSNYPHLKCTTGHMGGKTKIINAS
jgi:hypothetical protein